MLKPVTATMLLLFAPVAMAQGVPYGDLASLGGSMQAAAETCGGYSAAQLAQMKAEQRRIAVQKGISPAAFERAFKSGYAKGKTRIATASPAQKQSMCRDVRPMAKK